MRPLRRGSRIPRLLGTIAAMALAAAHAPGQAVVTRITGPQPWRAANADSDSVWFPERNEMAISKDNRWVVFESGANNLIPDDRNPYADIFVFEVATGRVIGITSNANFAANAWSYDPAISADGRYVVFASNATNLIANDTNNDSDVFLVDRDPDGNGIFDEQPYTFERISVDSHGNEGHGWCDNPAISDDGTRVLFNSEAPDLVANDNNSAADAFLRDRLAHTTVRVDVDSNGNEANYGCGFCDLSADGNVAAFWSISDNLVSGDTNGAGDVFVRDLSTGKTERVSVGRRGAQANAQSFIFRHCLSDDGSMVAFESDATNLFADTNGWRDVFVRDRVSAVTVLVSVDSNGVQGNGDSVAPTISGDGLRVTFVSYAGNLVGNDGSGNADVFLHDLYALTTTLVSVAAGGGASGNGESAAATISSDGTQVVFSSTASNLVSMGDVAGFRDVFLADLAAGTMRYVTAIPAGEANGPSMASANDRDMPTRPVLSKDGRYVVFESDATNLIDSDGNGFQDVFVADRTTGAIARVSISSSGDAGNDRSWGPTISESGRFVGFASVATNLIASDANGGKSDVYMHDRDPDANGIFDEGNGTTTSVSVDSSGIQANDDSDGPSISADGAKVAFASTATNLTSGDRSGSWDIFVHDMVTGQTDTLTDFRTNTRPSISADGSHVTFQYNFTDYSYIYGQEVWTLGTDNYDIDITTDQLFDPGDGYCAGPCISADGTRVAYSIYYKASDTFKVGVADIDYAFSDPFARVETSLFPGLMEPSMNSSGRQLTFYVGSSLSADDTNTMLDVYLIDVEQDASGVVSGFSDPILVSKGIAGVAGNADSVVSVPSDDGNLVAFASDASDLVANDTNGFRDVFLYDRTKVARWLNYGSGFASPHAIPDFTSDLPPVLGSTITLSIGNSSGIPVGALIYVGTRSADIAFNWGATLLVDLSSAISVVVPIGGGGGSLPGTVPNDPALSGISVYLQALEADAAVPHRLSFTPGLELHFGQ